LTHRFVREGEVDRVVDVIAIMAAECKKDLSPEKVDE